MKLYCANNHVRKTRGFRPEPDELSCEECGLRMGSFKSRTEPALKPPKAKRRKRFSFTPASKEQREAAAVASHCTACGRARSEYVALDPAHLPKRGAHGGCDDPLCTPFALCRVFDGSGCHRDFDDGKLDLLAIVSAEPDRYRAALQHALEHMGLVELVERLAGARTQWSDYEQEAA